MGERATAIRPMRPNRLVHAAVLVLLVAAVTVLPSVAPVAAAGTDVVTITATSPSIVFGQTVPTIDYTVTGALPGVPISTPACTTSAGVVPTVGSYATRCTGPASDANYTYAFVDGTLTVAKAAVTVTLQTTPAVPVLGQAVTLTATVRVVAPGGGSPGSFLTLLDGAQTLFSGTPTGGSVSYTTSALQVGTHRITASFYGSKNYLPATSAPSSLVVGKAPVTITAESRSIALGEPVPTIGFAAAGVVGAMPVTVPACSADAVTGVGSVPTSCLGPPSDASYDYTYASGVLSVGKALVTVTAADASMVLGKPVPAVGFTASGVVPGIPAAQPVCSAAQVTGAGTFATSCSGPDSDDSYVYAYVNGTLSVAKAPVKVTAWSPSIVFGEVVPAIGFTLTGLVPGFPAATPSCSAPPVVAAGSYATNCTGPTTDASYDYTYRNGSLTIAKGPTAMTIATATPSPVFGQAMTVISTVNVIAPATGTPTTAVSLLEGTTVLSTVLPVAGKAMFTTSRLAVGTHLLTARFLESANFSTSTDAVLTVKVRRALTTTSLSTSVSAPAPGQPVTLTATVSVTAPGSGTPGAAISISDGPTLLYVGVPVSGKVTFTMHYFDLGTHPLSASFAGSGNFAASASPLVSLVVVRPPYVGIGPKMAMLGDSITSIGKAYLTAELSSSYALSVTGLPGAVTAKLQPYAADYTPTLPDRVVINLGTNDAALGTPGAEVDNELASMAATFAGSCVVVVTINAHTGPPPVGSTQGGADFNTRAQSLNDFIRATFPHVVDWDAALLAHNQADPTVPWLLPDQQVHPNAAGFAALGDLIRTAAAAC